MIGLDPVVIIAHSPDHQGLRKYREEQFNRGSIHQLGSISKTPQI